MRKVIRKVTHIYQYIGVFLVAVILFLTVLDIILRNLFTSFVPGVFETVYVSLSLTVFASVAFTQDEKLHVVIDFIYERLPRLGKWILSLISSLLFLGIVSVTTWQIYRFALRQMAANETTSWFRIPLWTTSVFAAIGMFLLAFSIIADLIYIIKDKGVLGSATD